MSAEICVCHTMQILIKSLQKCYCTVLKDTGILHVERDVCWLYFKWFRKFKGMAQ